VPEAARRPFLLLVLFALLGAADGLYLSFVHVDLEVGRGALSQVCHRFSSTGCNVTAGRFGDLYGIPVATYGLAGSLAIAVLAAVAWRRRERWEDPYRSTLVVLATIAVAASVVMAIFSFLEGAFCPFCVAWYFINVGIAWLAWRCRDAALGVRDTLDDSIGTPALLAALVFGATLFGTTAMMRTQKAELEAERDAVVIPAIAAELLAQRPQTVEVPDAPSKGPADAEVTFVEFGDFECPYCRKLFFGLEHYAQTSGHTTRIVFAHYPLDSACNPDVERRHPNACLAAFASECARQQDKFWEYAEKLFDNQSALQRDDLLGYATELGLDTPSFTTCLDAPATRDKIRADLELGAALGITGTPTFFTNGYKWTGALPPSILAGVVEAVIAGRAPDAPGSSQAQGSSQ
jgi:protein-disulfide isomerase/uncharacterized membrane protein